MNLLRLFSKPKHQPWPRCGICFHRTDPADICVHMLHAEPVCVWDCIHAGNHPAEDDELRLEELS